MSVTRISKNNIEFFKDFLMESYELHSNNILKLGAIEDGTACGAACFEVNKTVAELVSIFVAPAYRKRGIASEMLSTFSNLCAGTKTQALTVSFVDEENSGLHEFFKKSGFEIFEGSESYITTLGAVSRSDGFKKYIAEVKTVITPISFEEMFDFQKKAINRLLLGYGSSVSELESGSFSKSLSFGVFDNSGKAQGFLLCSQVEDMVVIDFLASLMPKATPTVAMIKSLYNALNARFSDELIIKFLAANPKVLPIAERLLGQSLEKSFSAKYGIRLF